MIDIEKLKQENEKLNKIVEAQSYNLRMNNKIVDEATEDRARLWELLHQRNKRIEELEIEKEQLQNAFNEAIRYYYKRFKYLKRDNRFIDKIYQGSLNDVSGLINKVKELEGHLYNSRIANRDLQQNSVKWFNQCVKNFRKWKKAENHIKQLKKELRIKENYRKVMEYGHWLDNKIVIEQTEIINALKQCVKLSSVSDEAYKAFEIQMELRKKEKGEEEETKRKKAIRLMAIEALNRIERRKKP